jgi:hypothetical protein
MLEGGGMPEPAGKTLTEGQVLLIAKAARYQTFEVFIPRLFGLCEKVADRIEPRMSSSIVCVALVKR